jgi:LCP family protein required for cell wall assembly
MRRSWVVPLAAVAGSVLYVVLVGWLMLHGHLDAAVWLVLLAVVALLGLGVWQWRGGHRRTTAILVAAALVIVASSGWYGYTLNKKIALIPRVDISAITSDESNRPPKAPNHAVNILLMGADNPHRLIKQPTVAELLQDGEWDAGAYRSDTMMVVHVPADRKSAYVVSVPRDSYVPIYDADGEQHGQNKINEAFSAYGPLGTWRTIENLSQVRIDHMMVIDYAGFNDLTEAVGGVDVYVPQTVYDSQQDQEWTKGWHHIEGELALKYVRMRHGLLEGDFDRIDRQQNFLRAVLAKTLTDRTIGDPFKLNQVLGAITDHLAVDSSWSTGDIRGLALGLRGIDIKKVHFMTLPLARYETIPGVGDSNIIDTQAAKLLWRAVLDDKVAKYLKDHPDDELPDPRDVS